MIVESEAELSACLSDIISRLTRGTVYGVYYIFRPTVEIRGSNSGVRVREFDFRVCVEGTTAFAAYIPALDIAVSAASIGNK